MSGFEFLGDDVLHTGHAISLCRSRFRGPDGAEFTREVVRHPGAVSIVAVFEPSEVVLVRQYRAPLDRFMLEIPAGKRDVLDEPLEETARRELAEEVGLEAGTIEHLITFHNSVGFCDEESDVFLATELKEVGHDPQGIEEENMEIVRVRLSEVPGLIRSGKISDAKTVIGLMAAMERLR